jgi:hypothetical protein
LPLNTISMGQTQPTKTNRVWLTLGPRWFGGGRPSARWSPSSVQPRASAVQYLVQFGSAREGSGPACCRHAWGSLGEPLSLHGEGRLMQHAQRAQRVGGSTVLHPVKRVGGSMPGSCAGDGGCSGGRQRLPIGLARVKAGRQRLGRHCPFQGGGGALKQGLPAFGEGVVAFQKSNK